MAGLSGPLMLGPAAPAREPEKSAALQGGVEGSLRRGSQLLVVGLDLRQVVEAGKVCLELRETVDDRGGDAIQDALCQVAQPDDDLAVRDRHCLAAHELRVADELLQVTQDAGDVAILLDELRAQLHLDLLPLLLRHVLRVAEDVRAHAHVHRGHHRPAQVLLDADRLLDLQDLLRGVQPSDLPHVAEHRAALRAGLRVPDLHLRQRAVLRRRLQRRPVLEV
eukprot:CAMPEP_0176201128 /NCGR_PEP_ID=MMETSP0121_2-20121125/9408_1 /TAXON_ID=160619 /ORGANISM="Kryptoperidinium foliaceum, Strain CCMP 1326" /LENGTH=221 /DNA_ID=CAMNT_0017539999 /DNA_START=6 /DNA_END=669 /DNA_ORIENTATION=+